MAVIAYPGAPFPKSIFTRNLPWPTGGITAKIPPQMSTEDTPTPVGNINYGYAGSSITGSPIIPTLSYPQAVMVTTGLIAYYRLEETSGETAFNELGANHGTIVNPSNITLGTSSLSGLDKCYTFLGINGYINLPQLVGAGDYSIECWFKTSAIPPGGIDNPLAPAEQGFGLVQSTNGGDDDWGLALARSGGKTLVTAQCGSTYTGPFFGMTSNPAIDYSDGQWHYVLLTHVRSSGLSRLYVDGVLHEEDTLDTGPQDATGSIRIGSIQFGNRGFMNGQIDEVAIYNIAITEADMLAHLATLPWP